jgi:Flp pilus assembly protein TadB
MVWIVVAVLAVLLVVAVVLLWRARRSQRLRERFGPEYERALAEHGDRRAAESELLERRERRQKFELQPLERAARERYAERWRMTQRRLSTSPHGRSPRPTGWSSR